MKKAGRIVSKRRVISGILVLITAFCLINLSGYGTTANAASSNLALNKAATASSVHSSLATNLPPLLRPLLGMSDYTAARAVDGSASTRWATPDGTTACWLEIDFGAQTVFNQTIIKELYSRVTAYTIQYWNGTVWVDASSGTSIGASKTDTFTPVASSKLRLNITSANAPPSIWEFEVYSNTQELSRASTVLIDKGLQIHSWITTDTTGRKFPTADDFTGTNMSGVTYYEAPLYNKAFHTAVPNAQWNLAKAPYCTNAVGQNPPNNADFLTADQLANIDQAVSFCFGDEQGYSTAEVGYLKNWFALSHQLYPNVLCHANTYLDQWSSSQLDTYVSTAKPDLLTIDYYYFDQLGTVRDYQIPAKIMDAVNTIRPKALAGIDGTGNSPIAFGQYLLGYKSGINQAATGWYEITESQKYLVTNLTLAMGGKWLDMFRWEYSSGNDFLLFDSSGAPTRHYSEYAECFRQAENLGPHLVRLNSTGVSAVPGKHMGWFTAVSNSLPSTVPAFAANTEYHLSNITAVNLGSQNNGLPGDVTVGYFKPLPGLSTSAFFTSPNPKYFMIVNGLTQGNGLQASAQHGSLNETQQKITMTFDMSNGDPTKLRKVDRSTGAVLEVNLTPVSGTTYKLEDTLGGGQADLFFWAE